MSQKVCNWFHTSILFFQILFKHTSNTLQHPSNTLKTPINTLQTTFKIIYFFRSKNGRKKINRDFIKGGRGGSSFYEVISQKIFFFTNDGFPKIFCCFCSIIHAPRILGSFFPFILRLLCDGKLVGRASEPLGIKLFPSTILSHH